MDANTAGSEIVRIQREARFADTSTDEWARRLTLFIAAQDEVRGDVRVSDVRQVGTAAGGSNGTLLFQAEFYSAEGRVSRDFVLRFLPVKGLFQKYDIAAQFNLQHALEATDVPVPIQYWLDQTGAYLERPGYIMGRVRGESPPMTWMTSGIIKDASPEDRGKMFSAHIKALATIHAVDWRAAGLEWMQERASGSRPMEREVNWYSDALAWSKMPSYVEMLAPVRAWLIANEPDDVETVICHGDANLGNYMFDGVDITAVVDWEMSFLGAPECEVCYLMIGDQMIQNDVAPLEGVPSYEAFKQEYEAVSGRRLKHMPYFELHTFYRVAVINVLAMGHFPAEVLQNFMPILERGPRLCVQRARALGAAV